MKFDYDVLIVGAGPAGLSAAMTLGRIGRSALVCDDNRPRNAPSSHVNNFITRDGIQPAEWRNQARKDLDKYKTIEFFQGSVLSVAKRNPGFSAELSSGSLLGFKRLLLAYGVEDKLPQIPGFQELWGKSVFHCPYCHGYEVRGLRLGLVSNDRMTEHLLPITFGLSSDLVLFTNGKADLDNDLRRCLEKRNVELVEERIEKLIFADERLTAVALENGKVKDRDALFLTLPPPFQTKSSIGEELGCEKNEMGFYKIGERGETTVKGVFAAGDNASAQHSVLLACGSGVRAGSGIVFDLLNEEFRA